jgi:hypothetical protein
LESVFANRSYILTSLAGFSTEEMAILFILKISLLK